MRNDSDGIYQRPDSPYWWVSWTDSRGGAARRSTRIKVSADPKGTQARKARAAMMAESEHQTDPAPDDFSFDRLMNLYLDQEVAKRALKTQRVYHYIIGRLFEHFTGMEMSAFRADTVRRYIERLEDEGFARNTIRGDISLMSAATNWAIHELEWPIPNPWHRRKPAEPEPRKRWLTTDEADKLLNAAEAMGREKPGQWAWLADYIRLCLYAGLRKQEASDLTWDRIDLEGRVIRFSGKDQKNGKAQSIPFNREVWAALARRRAATTGERVFPKVAPCHGVRTAARRAKVFDVTIHDLRRTFGSWLAQKGVPIQRISRLMRHSGVAVTDRVYAHLSTEALADAAAALDEAPPRLQSVK
ncbi:tyrosine-type recombinase/integrase [Methylomagnum ishizawai]|uniref:tyrosine-type recombinase/integrase n=1 Tax=Methylomagnum ishizawai TaxID=1760988 RepID=UPI001C337006|nr:site-specific integrase [Methylomagnum ishizawai]BBL75613.1 hypothetical protein MishRS11D_27110 [Methylomagnum ishizawai]